ncbi:choice-of-anchor I family protein [Povalibacter sp.]|uniref:choice-of-anchor I family protein n=1 Tax=Povalibacter sp. TaxID=1962978 RepID=UPI002F407CD5
MFDRAVPGTLSAAVALILSCAAGAASAHDHHGGSHGHHDDCDANAAPITLTRLGTYDAGDAGSAEIVAYDVKSRRLFVVNAATSTIDVLNARNPRQPTKITTIDTAAFGSPNSVAVGNGLVAVAIQSTPKTDPGRVAFYDVDGKLLSAVRVGALPDMLTFTPDGNYVLVANEAEPSGYGAGHVDPEGSVSIIRIPGNAKQVRKLKDSDVRTASFTRFNGQEAALRSQGIRIYGPGASAAQDFEPEYIAVSADSRKAYVTLQENNAIAEIDIERAQVTHLRPLGFKDYSMPPQATATYEWKNRPSIGATAAGQKLQLGGFSGLAFEGVTGDGQLSFITHTDRGPNGEPVGVRRPFLLPQFNPHLVRFTLDPANGRFELQEQIALRAPNGRLLTGVSNILRSQDGNQPYNDEAPVDLRDQQLPLDPLGGDFEGIAIDADGTYWMADEYRPAIYHFSKSGRLIERLIPIGTHAAAGVAVPAPGTAGHYGTEALPAEIAQRRQNRGMEGIAIQDGKIYGFVQSPIRNPATLANGALNAMKNVRVVEYDPATRATRQFIYIMDNPPSVSADDTRADKIGDVAALPGGGFLVLERDDDAVPEDPIGTITKKIYATSLREATDISGLGAFLVNGVSRTVDQMTADELASVGVRPATKTLHVDLAQAGYAGVEKIEGLALLPNGQLALVNDNDFGVAGIVIDNATGRFTIAPGYVPEDVELGLVSVPGLDASDRDNAISIRSWPVFGMYQPDTIARFSVGRSTYLITANEGDARDWTGFAEEARVGSLTLDPTAFPNATALKNNASLGRLNVTKSLGDIDGDGDYDALYTLGGRSFSIWNPDGTQVYDSGSDFERIIAAANPAFFNVSNDDRTFDSRSDNKGPEPEAVAVGEVGKRTYAFIGLERQGGVMVYDVTTPRSPVFVDYVNNRDLSVDPATAPAAKDLGPEGIIFIDAKDSPTRDPLLVVANEISGTVTIYAVSETNRD